MRVDGIFKAVKGVTTIDEVMRLTRGEEIRRAIATGEESEQ